MSVVVIDQNVTQERPLEEPQQPIQSTEQQPNQTSLQSTLPVVSDKTSPTTLKPANQNAQSMKTIQNQRQNFHLSQQNLKNISVSQSPGNVKQQRFSQIQNLDKSKEKKKQNDNSRGRNIVSTSPQVKPTKAFKTKSKVNANSSNIILMGKQMKGQDKPKKELVVAVDEKRSVFNNNDGSYRYYIGWGNNEGIVKRVMQKRTWWRETSESNTMLVNFKWQQSNRGYRYERLIISQNYKQLVNHFEHHREISNKQYLLQNLTQFCENLKLNVFDFTPLTFTFDFADDNCDYNVNQFLRIYEQNIPITFRKQQGIDNISKYILEYKRRLRGHFTQGFYNYKDYNSTTKYKMTSTYMTGENSKFLWLLKPTFLNRGRGIHVFSSLETLAKLIQEYQEGYIERSLANNKNKDDQSDEENESAIKKFQENSEENMVDSNSTQPQSQETVATPNKDKKPSTTGTQKSIHQNKKLPQLQQQQQQSTPVDPNTYIRTIPSGPCIIKSHAFVVQKYIEKPTLINQRKFDVRVWAMITHELDAYYFPEGYIRTSCEVFDPNDTQNQFIHLTNNAIQKFSQNYGQFESGNQLSWQQYQEYLQANEININFDDIRKKMKELVWMSFSSVKRKINFEDRKFCFEIFGFDFIIDENFQVWLIEVNTNPCIEESSPLLQILLPRMLDDGFKLTLDVLFPRKTSHSLKPSISQNVLSKYSSKDDRQAVNATTELPKITEHKNEDHTEYPVPGYPDDENMWELLGTLNERRKQLIDKKRQWRSEIIP